MTTKAAKQQQKPAREKDMDPPSKNLMEDYKAAGKLEGKVALISGADSGIGRAVAIGFAKEGADVAFIYLEEDEDAAETVRHVEKAGRKCLMIKGDIGVKKFCTEAVEKTVKALGGLNLLINNAGEWHEQEELADITEEQLKRTFDTNIFGMFYLTQAALEHMKKGDAIVNTASLSAYQADETGIDYAATKGAVVAFTRSLSTQIAKKGIRVNAVAPGPVWTPIMLNSPGSSDLESAGEDAPMGRAAQPDEIAPSFIFLASDDASYITGQVMHPNGGTIINS